MGSVHGLALTGSLAEPRNDGQGDERIEHVLGTAPRGSRSPTIRHPKLGGSIHFAIVQRLLPAYNEGNN